MNECILETCNLLPNEMSSYGTNAFGKGRERLTPARLIGEDDKPEWRRAMKRSAFVESDVQGNTSKFAKREAIRPSRLTEEEFGTDSGVQDQDIAKLRTSEHTEFAKREAIRPSRLTEEEFGTDSGVQDRDIAKLRTSEHTVGLLKNECSHCGALYFDQERKGGKFTECCHMGAVTMGDMRPIPAFLMTQPSGETTESIRFIRYARDYNNVMSAA